MLPRVRHAATRNRIEKNKTTSGSYPLVGSFTKKQVSVQKNTFALDPGWGSPKKAVRATATKNNNRPPLNNKKRARNDKLKGTFGSPLCFLGFTILVAQQVRGVSGRCGPAVRPPSQASQLPQGFDVVSALAAPGWKSRASETSGSCPSLSSETHPRI